MVSPAKNKFVVILTSFFLAIVSSTASFGITFGKEVTNGASIYPSVISIWYAEDDSTSPSFICTGTLIEPRIVLTAAHCVLSGGLYYVKYGADILDDDTELLEVSATWRNPRYSERQMVNDIGLLLLSEEIIDAEVTTLPSSSTIKKAQSSKSVKYEIVGWGKDQNSDMATYLRKAVVDDQTSLVKKYKGWRNDVWFAVGKYNKKERVFAGACNGDSGGPLFAILNGKPILAGVTSWGAEDCELGMPSIYVRLSYYIDTINNSGIPTLLKNETKQNRALPSPIVEPSISGVALPDSTLTCNSGTWSENTQSVSLSWTGPGLTYGANTPSIKVSKVSYESTYTCEVTATNSNGSTTRKVTITQAAPPQVVKNPSILGLPNASDYQASNTLTCAPATFNGATSVQTYWWIGLSYSSADTRIGTGTTLNLTKELISKYGGGYIYCQSVASGPGGNTQSSSSVYLSAWPKPYIKSGWPRVSTQSTLSGSFVGDLLSCSQVTWDKPVDTEAYSIYIRTGLSENKILSNTSTYVMTSDVINNYQNYEIHCSVTASNAGGTYTASSSYGFTIRAGVKPDAPGALTGIIGPTTVSLSWIAPANNGVAITDYVIERSLNGGSWVTISDGISTGVSYIDAGLTPGARYGYRVRAFNGAVYSDYSSTISANIPVAASPTPTASASPTPTASPSPTPTASASPTPTALGTPTITGSSVTTSLGADASGNQKAYEYQKINVSATISSPSLVQYLVFGLKPVASTNFYDWGQATSLDGGATWTRVPELPAVNPAPVCTDGVSSSVMWEVKYLVHLKSGAEFQGVLPTKIARVLNCPVGLTPTFGNITSTQDGYTSQVTNYDSAWTWELGTAVRPELTLTGTVSSTINTSGLITVSGLKPGVSIGVTVTTTRTGYPTKSNVLAGSSSP